MQGFLRETVDENASVDLNDMVPLKRSLGSLGHYRPTEGVGLHEFPDEPLFKGIRSFQKREGLKVDGIMKPGGPTEKRLLKRIAEKKGKDGSFVKNGPPWHYGNHAKEAPSPGAADSDGPFDNWLGDVFRSVSGAIEKRWPTEQYNGPYINPNRGTSLHPGIHGTPGGRKPSKPKSPAKRTPSPHPSTRPNVGKPMS